MMEVPDNWHVLQDPEAVAREAVALILSSAEEALQRRGSFHLVTAGGTTPLLCYRLLAQETLPSPEKWHIYMGDERCLPERDPDRNSVALEKSWLSQSTIPQTHWHFMPAELGAAEAATRYQEIIRDQTFDLVMLGMGEDGHTASLFPGHDYPKSEVVTEFHAPKMPPERLSLSFPKLSDASLVLKLITGKAKAKAVSQWLEGEVLPIAQIKGDQTIVLLDVSAYPKTMHADV